jgi:ketosteroid isomerase-like protein
MRKHKLRFVGFTRAAVILLVASMVLAVPAIAQKNKDKKKGAPDAGSEAGAQFGMPPMPDSQAIDRAISEELGYWQIGDVESMHKYFADDVVVISGAWEAPVVGWDNYVRAYQAQRARVSGGRMDRSNTFIKVNGNSAWATYQFVYVATMDNNMVQFRGHTTLILNKQSDRWVITLNHSSVVDSAVPAATPSVSSQAGNP